MIKKVMKFFSMFFVVALLTAGGVRAEDTGEVLIDDGGAFLDFGAALTEDSLDGDIDATAQDFDVSYLGGSLTLNSGAAFINVDEFDIAGIMLGMPFESVRVQFFRTHGVYAPAARNSITYRIPREWRYNLDYECRQQKIYAPSDLEKCVNSAAKKRGFLYPARMRLERPETGEKIVVHFTSNATNNVVWKVVYTNDVNEIEGADEKFTAQRNNKILAFWEMVLEKYGAPNSGQDKWISSDNTADPHMTAGYGEMILVDAGLDAADRSDNVIDSTQRFRSKPYSF